MTPEQRLDRLERIARLLAQPDLRAEEQSRKQFEKLRLMVEEQRKNDERFAKMEEAQRRLETLDPDNA
jgi:hypothetical protein